MVGVVIPVTLGDQGEGVSILVAEALRPEFGAVEGGIARDVGHGGDLLPADSPRVQGARRDYGMVPRSTLSLPVIRQGPFALDSL